MLMDSRISWTMSKEVSTCFYWESNSYMSVVEAFAYKLSNSYYYCYYYYYYLYYRLLSQVFSPWYFS